jgi:SAM-dependent methyltransferase
MTRTCSRHPAPDPPADAAPTDRNRRFYDLLWSQSRLIAPHRFTTWPLISRLLPHAPQRLEVGPGLRPRLPVPGTHFIDISPVVIERLQAAGGLAATGDLAALPFRDRTFHLAAAFDVLEHVADDDRVLGELSRVLTPGGMLVCSVPLHAALWTGFDEMAGHVRRYEPPEIAALLAAHGLGIEGSAAYGMQPASPRLLELGMWFLRHRRREAMWWYNNILMPLGLFFQKPLEFRDGLIDTAGVDEIVLICRKIRPQAAFFQDAWSH